VWSYNSTPTHVLTTWFLAEYRIGVHVVYLVKHWQSFITFYLTIYVLERSVQMED